MDTGLPRPFLLALPLTSAAAPFLPLVRAGENDQFNRVDLRPGSFMDRVQKLFKKVGGGGCRFAGCTRLLAEGGTGQCRPCCSASSLVCGCATLSGPPPLTRTPLMCVAHPCLAPQLTGFAMPLQDALTGAGILNLPYGPFPLPVPLVTVVGAPLRLPPFSSEGGC